MTDTTRYATERRYAPHVDPRWAEGLLLELRLQGVAGDRIGPVLAEVDAHVVDSGESAQDAFGDPVRYARSLGLPVSPAQSRSATARVVAASGLQLVGMLAVLWSFPAVLDGEPLEATAGLLLVLVLVTAGVVALGAFADRVVRAALAHPVLVGLACAGGAGAVVALGAAVRTPLVSAPAVVVLVAGALLLAAATVWEAAELRDGADPVVGPGESGAAPRDPRGRLAALTGVLAVPVATVVLVVVTLLLPRG